MSLIRDITDSIARKLRESEYYRTTPVIPVVSEDSKDIMAEIDAAATKGCMVLVNFDSGDDVATDAPGPCIDSASFTVTVSEAPQVWRASSRNLAPSAAAVAEATARLLHHFQPVDRDDAALVSGVLMFDGMQQRANESFLQYVLTFTLPVILGNQTEPTR